jgi:hypothetical protein
VWYISVICFQAYLYAKSNKNIFGEKQMKIRKRSLQSAILLLTILFSISMLNPAKAQESNPPPKNPPPPGMTQFNGTYISWAKQQNTTQDTWSWTNQAWEFGPYPNFAIYLQNGTEVTDVNFIPLGVPFKVVINIQKSIFIGNTTLGRAGLQWNTELRTQNGTISGNANCRMVYINKMETKFWNESNAWHVESFVFNQSAKGTMGQPSPPPQMQQNSFYKFDNVLSRVIESSELWRIEIVGTFNATSTPMGPYWVNLEVTDQSDSWIDFGYRAWQGKRSPNRMVAVGKPGFIYGGFQDTWTFEKLDMENKPVLSVSKGTQWKMRFNVTSSILMNVTIGFDLAWNVKKFVNVTNWYQKAVTQQGGWMYNETSGTYYWNSTVLVTRTEQVYGPHLEERWINVQHGRQINVTRQYWDPTTNEPKLVTEQQWVQDRMFLIYDHATHSFDVKQGYSYWAYDENLLRDREFQVLNPVNTSDPTTQFYNLSLTDSNWYHTEPNKCTIEFVGSFSNTTYSDRDEYWLQISVYGTNGQIGANWENTNPSDFQIAVDKPVAVSTILDSQGRPVKGWMFQTDRGDSFTVQSKVYGASKLYQDIDGVGVVFRSGFGTWSANESYNSDVEIRLVKDLTTGALSSVTYNRTNRNKFVYGPHKGWAYVNVTDWHMEYNATTGQFEWINSPHLVWNETTITDWHWEYSRLNQTEYARDPNSPNIWIDTTMRWVSDMDPAFRMLSSYAELNSANVALVNGLVIVNMSVTFVPTAPESNYWWNMIFQNMTYGRDWSQGWGEHVVTEWTSEPIYYVNGTVTGGQAWYVNKPSTPLYTTYNGTKYQLNQLPYITVGGVDLPIKVRTQYDQWRQEEWTEYLYRDPYNPSLGKEPKYYELLNGTKIYVQEAYQAIIRSLQLNCSDAYIMVDGSKVPLPNGTAFSTYMNRAGQDFAEHFWDPVLQMDIVPCNYELINGTRIYRNAPFETPVFNATTNHWEITNPTYTESVTTLLVESVGSGITLNKTVVLLREPGFWQPLPDGSGYYLIMKNGTRITIRDPWGVPDNQRVVTINGLNYLIGWPNQYYKGTYEDQTLFIRGGGWDGYVRNFYYTDLGVEGGTRYELPYAGAMATSWWDLEGLESEGRKLRTFKSMTINGVDYVLYFDEDTKSYYIVVDGLRESVTYPVRDVDYYYSKINGEEYWNVVQNGWILKYGTYADKSNQFSSTGSLVTITGYDPLGHMWSDNNRYGYDYENSTLYIKAPDGTRTDLHSGMYLIVWKVKVGNQTFYTTDQCEHMESFTDNKTGQIMYRNYFKTLENETVYFNWNDNPPNWLEEIHILIPGTNYTRLIPFSWQPQQVFDKIYVYNITIPELLGNPTHTDVYYADGSEVPVNATFKVFGTSYGPGTQYNYGWNNTWWIAWGAYIPGTNAPWNNSKIVNYFTTLEGTRIYSYQPFGWVGNGWGEPKQWNYINGDPVAGNKTVNVVEGGYCIYLNDTTKVDVTTPNPYGGVPNQYLIMTNGTYLNIHWIDWPVGKYTTRIGDNEYLFRGVMTYYNLTDSGTVYYLGDPFQGDFRQILTPSVYQTPTISTNSSTWMWMNATTDSILHDGTGYYLINASALSRLDLQLVDDWWNLSTTVRKQVFKDQLSNYYPRFSVTLNGMQFFVLDPNPVVGTWWGEGTIEQSLYRYPSSLNVDLGGKIYSVTLFQGEYWRPDLRWRRIETITVDGTGYEVEEQHQWKPSYQVTIDGESLDVQLATMSIYKRHKMWGDVYTWMLTDLSISTSRQVNDIIVGTPKNGMWGIQAFAVVEDTGAIDLDGDLTTTEDQYFVRRIHSGSNIRNETIDRMWVEIIWNPNSSRTGDEVHVGAWMGKLHVTWTSEWSESYIWYYASNMTNVSTSTMEQIRSTVIDNATEQAKPGYWDIAHMVQNQTWADLIAKAKRENWNWITDNTNEWEWLWFGTQQDYMVNLISGNVKQNVGVGLRYEFAGLSLFNNTEQTHFFMPKSVSNVSFVTPGEAFGNTNATGNMIVPLNATIDFGVAYDNVNGTLFPYSDQRSMWGWWDRPVFGADFEAPNFMNKPTPSTVDQLVFAIHFAANQTSGSDLYNKASMKIDQRVGNWDLEPDVIDGRTQNSSGVMVPLRGNDVLSNRSMAINYYVTASSSMVWDVMDERGSSVDNNNVTESSRFDIGSRLANVNFASVKLGSTYDWSKPTTPTDVIRTLNVTSKTSPIGNFKASYQSDAGKSSTGFDISASMYFLTIGFTRWDGYAIYNDPEVSFLLSKGMAAQAQPPTEPPTEQPEEEPEEEPTESPTEQPTEPPTEPPVEPPTEPPVKPFSGTFNAGGAEIPVVLIVVGAVAAAAGVAAVFVVFRARARRGLPNVKIVKN